MSEVNTQVSFPGLHIFLQVENALRLTIVCYKESRRAAEESESLLPADACDRLAPHCLLTMRSHVYQLSIQQFFVSVSQFNPTSHSYLYWCIDISFVTAVAAVAM